MRELKIYRFLMIACVLGAVACGPTTETKYLTKDDPGTATIKIYKNNSSTSKNVFTKSYKQPFKLANDVFLSITKPST